MKKTERTGKAFYMKWLLLALFCSSTDHNAGSFPESIGSQNGLYCEV